jgi:hypothetical protein
MQKNNLIGQVFGKLTVINEAGRSKKMEVLWKCQCICGGFAISDAYNLRKKRITSCGCNRTDAKKHGMARKNGGKPPIYAIWASMIQRCSNSKNVNWKNYGGRGITVCDEWTIFLNFYNDMGDRPINMSLDRIDNSKGYSKANCRWTAIETQARNKRINVWIDIAGEVKILNDWVKTIGTSLTAVHYRTKNKNETQQQALIHLMEKKHGKHKRKSRQEQD